MQWLKRPVTRDLQYRTPATLPKMFYDEFGPMLSRVRQTCAGAFAYSQDFLQTFSGVWKFGLECYGRDIICKALVIHFFMEGRVPALCAFTAVSLFTLGDDHPSLTIFGAIPEHQGMCPGHVAHTRQIKNNISFQGFEHLRSDLL